MLIIVSKHNATITLEEKEQELHRVAHTLMKSQEAEEVINLF